MHKLFSLVRRNDGMTMIEMTVAIVLGAIILTAGAGTLASAMGGVNQSRQNQQSAALLSEILEETRGVDYAAAAVKFDAAALAADTRVTGSGGSYYADPDGAGPLGAEKMVVSATGSVPLTRTVERNKTNYTVSTYVTEPTGADAAYRRVTTVVNWTKGAKTYERRTASFVTNTRRGLPLPNFSVAEPLSMQVNTGAQLRLPVEVTNSGARDAWNMSTSTLPARSWNFTYYADNAPVGSFGAEDAVLADTDGNGVGDTGPIETDRVMKMWAVADIPANDLSGSISVSLTATSASDSTFAESVVDQVAVVGQSCAGCTWVPYYPLNATTTPQDSLLQPLMPLSPTPDGVFSPSDAVPNFDTDKNSHPGRALVRGGGDITSTGQQVAIWRMQMPSATTIGGPALVTLAFAPQGVEPNKTTQVRAYLAQTAAGPPGSFAEVAHGDTSFSFSNNDFAQETISMTVPNTTIGKNKSLYLIVVVPGGEHDQVALGYGTDHFRSNILLPVR